MPHDVAETWGALLKVHAALVPRFDRELQETHGLPLTWYDVLLELNTAPNRRLTMGRLGSVARLLPTTAATTLRKDDPPLVLDGPYAETKEQLLGFYLVDCKDLDAALDVARDLAAVNPGGAYEIRPVGHFTPGSVQP